MPPLYTEKLIAMTTSKLVHRKVHTSRLWVHFLGIWELAGCTTKATEVTLSILEKYSVYLQKISLYISEFCRISYKRISQMTYQPKSTSVIITDFEKFDPRFSLNSSQIWIKNLVRKVLSVPSKKCNSQLSSVFKLILLPTHCCYGLEVTWNPCIDSETPLYVILDVYLTSIMSVNAIFNYLCLPEVLKMEWQVYR